MASAVWRFFTDSGSTTASKVIAAVVAIVVCAMLAGTNEPTWAISVINAVCRNKADLPLMLGPVRMMIC